LGRVRCTKIVKRQGFCGKVTLRVGHHHYLSQAGQGRYYLAYFVGYVEACASVLVAVGAKKHFWFNLSKSVNYRIGAKVGRDRREHGAQ